MALPSGLNLKIELLFPYKSDTPQIRITDETDYTAEGRVATNIRGVIQLVNSEGIIAYQNTTFDAPDLDLSVSNVVTITPSNCGCGGKITWCDTFTLTYSIRDISDNQEFTKNFVKYLCFTPFEAKLSWRLDCYTATLSSTDCSSYKQNGITPSISEYAHLLESKNESPLNFSKLKTEFNFDCGKSTQVVSNSYAQSSSGLTNLVPFSYTFDTSDSNEGVNEFRISVRVYSIATITIRDASSSVIDTRPILVGQLYTYSVNLPSEEITVEITTSATVSSGGVVFTADKSTNSQNSEGDSYSKCCNTITLSYPNLYSGLHKHSVSADLTYNLGDNWFIIYSINACEEFEVECNTDICKIVCALYDKFKTFKNLLCKNPSKAEPMREKLQWAYSLLALHDKLLKCGYEQKASDVIQGILDDLGISKSDCGCGCSGDNCEPQKILPILNKDTYVLPQIMILEGDGIDVRLDNQTDPLVNAYVVSAETSDFDEYEYLTIPFTSTNLIAPMAFSTPFDKVVQIDAIDANFVETLQYSVNRGSFTPITLPLTTPITISASAHVIWKATITAIGDAQLASGSINLKYKIV